MTPDQAAWVREHVFTPGMRKEYGEVPGFYEVCACQYGTTTWCRVDKHGRCHRATPAPSYETVICRRGGMEPLLDALNRDLARITVARVEPARLRRPVRRTRARRGRGRRCGGPGDPRAEGAAVSPPVITCPACGEDRPHRARGWCDPCYNRWARRGKPETGPPEPARPRITERSRAQSRINLAAAQEATRQRTAERLDRYASLRRRNYSIAKAAQWLEISRRTADRYEARLRNQQQGAIR